jgi:superfamily II helicase
MVSVPVGVVVLEADAEATVMVITSFAPGAGVVLAAESVVFDTTGVGAVTVTVSEPLEEA